MSRIFISYRRDDSAGYALLLRERLIDRFGADQVFMDIGGIQPGADFRKAINDAVGSCSALIALIGKQWLTIEDDLGQRRLNNPHDLVRLEIAAALRRDIPVIPALVREARMPAEDELPDDLKDLAWRQAVELSDLRFDEDTNRLLKVLDKVISFDTSKSSNTGSEKLLDSYPRPDAEQLEKILQRLLAQKPAPESRAIHIRQHTPDQVWFEVNGKIYRNVVQIEDHDARNLMMDVISEWLNSTLENSRKPSD